MPVTNFPHLHEPAYVLGGMVLPETSPGLDDDGVLLFTGSDFLGFLTHEHQRFATGSPSRVDPQKLRLIHWQ